MTENQAQTIADDFIALINEHGLSITVNLWNIDDNWGVNLTASDPNVLVAVAPAVPE